MDSQSITIARKKKGRRSPILGSGSPRVATPPDLNTIFEVPVPLMTCLLEGTEGNGEVWMGPRDAEEAAEDKEVIPIYDFMGPGEGFVPNLECGFNIIIDEIDESIQDGKSVLLVCQNGRSCSPVLIMGYLMKKKGKSFTDAFAVVNKPWVQIGDHFLEVLRNMD